jgi:hypothetical protein
VSNIPQFRGIWIWNQIEKREICDIAPTMQSNGDFASIFKFCDLPLLFQIEDSFYACCVKSS